MSNDQIDELEKKKQALEQELKQIQGELDQSLDKMRDDVSETLDPKSIIRKHPLPIVGGAVLLGFLAGHRSDYSRRGTSSGFREALINELKKIATKKAIAFASDYVEEILEEKAEEHLSSNDL